MVLRATAESKLIKCQECGLVFGEDEAELCRSCHEHICPKCSACGCSPIPKSAFWKGKY